MRTFFLCVIFQRDGEKKSSAHAGFSYYCFMLLFDFKGFCRGSLLYKDDSEFKNQVFITGMIKDGGANPSTTCKIAAQQLAADSDVVGVVGAMRSSCSKASHQYFRDNGKSSPNMHTKKRLILLTGHLIYEDSISFANKVLRLHLNIISTRLLFSRCGVMNSFTRLSCDRLSRILSSTANHSVFRFLNS